MTNPSESRLYSLDLLRGLDMFYLACASAVISPLSKALGWSDGVRDFLLHHPWEGFTLYDLIMPLFIFMSGAAVPLGLSRRLRDGHPTRDFHRHVWTRVAMLWALGMLVAGGLASLDVRQLSPYNNTLQTIAVGYVATAYVLAYVRSWTARIAIPVALTVAYGLIVHLGGDYTQLGNVTQPFERNVLLAILPADNVQTAAIATRGYTWFLPSLMFPVLALGGCFSTQILQSGLSPWRRAACLACCGLGALAVGWLLAASGVKVVKHIFTVSFTWQAIGWSQLALTALYVLTDIWKFRP